MIVPVLALTAQLSLLSADAFAFTAIQEAFVRGGGKGPSGGPPLLAPGGVAIQGWLLNISKWISLFFAKHPFTDVGLILEAVASSIERHASDKMKASSFGNSLIQLIVTDLVEQMGTFSYVGAVGGS